MAEEKKDTAAKKAPVKKAEPVSVELVDLNKMARENYNKRKAGK